MTRTRLMVVSLAGVCAVACSMLLVTSDEPPDVSAPPEECVATSGGAADPACVAAVVAVDTVLRQVPTLPGALVLNESPAALLDQPPTKPTGPNVVDHARWWTAPGGVDGALDYLRKHVSDRYAFTGDGMLTDHGVRTMAWLMGGDLTFAQPATIVAVIPWVHGVAIRADAQMTWTSARPASDCTTDIQTRNTPSQNQSPHTPEPTVLTVTSNQGGPGSSVERRSLKDGSVVSTLVASRCDTTVSASQSRDGSIFVASSSTKGGCKTNVDRIDPDSQENSRVRTIGETVDQAKVSPDGTHLAYVTYPNCATATPPDCPGVCSVPDRGFPNVLVIVDLATGHEVRTATDMPGHPVFGLSWSPDSAHLAAGYDGDHASVLIIDAARPDLQHATQIPSPAGCVYSAPAWLNSGIVATRTCPSTDHPPVGGEGVFPGLSPDSLVRLDPAGSVLESWPLPRCINGTAAVPSHELTSALIQYEIGYGSDTCSTVHQRQLVRIDSTTTLLLSQDTSRPTDIWSAIGQ